MHSLSSCTAWGLVVLACCIVGALGAGCRSGPSSEAEPARVRVMTYNIEDVRTRDVRRSDHPRLRRAAARIQALAPHILLVNELAYDQPGAPGYEAGAPPGQNARRFAEQYLAVPQADSLQGQSYQTVMLPVNTGQPSGYDLNNDGRVVTEIPSVPRSPDDGRVPRRTAAGRAFGHDAWGFGAFPGQYGMAVFVRSGLDVLRDSIRTFRHFRWAAMPGAARPRDTTSGHPWHSDREWRAMRLSSKSHWDVPVRLPDGTVLHLLASHPTPPAFDGPARRNASRNHDEIRFWVDYVNDESYIEDDSGRGGGLSADASFVIVGDLNADPDDKSRFRDAIRSLLEHPRVNDVRPRASSPDSAKAAPLDADDTARWGKRVDYVLPSSNLAATYRTVCLGHRKSFPTVTPGHLRCPTPIEAI